MDNKLTLPGSISKLRLYHLQAIAEIKEEDFDIYAKLTLCSKLTGLPIDYLRTVSINNINEIVGHYMGLISDHKKKTPPKKIDVEGKKFKLIKSVGEQPLSWHIDVANFNTKDSSIMAAFCYIEEGMGYCEMDKHKNVLNPVTPRAEHFNEYLGADILIDLGFFFTEKFDKYRRACMEISRQRKKIQKKKEATKVL
jgi:hypothetical protein